MTTSPPRAIKAARGIFHAGRRLFAVVLAASLFAAPAASAAGSHAHDARLRSPPVAARSAKSLAHRGAKTAPQAKGGAPLRGAALRALLAQTRKSWEAGRGRALGAREKSRLVDLLRKGPRATLAEARAQAAHGEAWVAIALVDATKELWAREGVAPDAGALNDVKELVVENVQGALTAAAHASPDREAAIDQARSDLRAVGLALTPEAVAWVRGARATPPEAWTRTPPPDQASRKVASLP